MKITKTSGFILLSALALGVFAFSTIVWSAFTTTLEINGAAMVAMQGWDIHFDNISNVTLTGDAIEAVKPKLENVSTAISDYQIKLISPGDSAKYTFNIVNNGTFGAKLSTITNGTISCIDGNGETSSTDAKNVCDNITYSLKYTNTGEDVKENDLLKSKDSVNVTLLLKYNETVTNDKLPETEVTISGLSTTLLYVQDNNVTTTTGK